ncbi:hypothetical protein CRUP_033562, partial [Coryphaenoides rupestris]
SEVLELRRETLALLTASELAGPHPGPLVSSLGPGAVQYLLSLTRVALSAGLERPWRELWGGGGGGAESGARLLDGVLRCPVYEVRELALDGLLQKLGVEEKEEEEKGEEEEEEEEEKHTWLDQNTLLSSRGAEIPWRDGGQELSHLDVLGRLLSLVQRSAHSVELRCAALALASRLLVQLMTSDPQTLCASNLPSLWGALVCGCCGDDQPAEVKLAVTGVLVNSTAPLLTSPALPLGLSTTLSLWRSLLTLLQDEDQDVRDSASDFISHVAPHLLQSADTSCPRSMSPPVALDE